MACHCEAIKSKSTRHHEFGTTVNVFKVIFLGSTSRKSLDKRYKQGTNAEFGKKQTYRPQFYKYRRSTGCNASTDKPHDQGYSDTARRP